METTGTFTATSPSGEKLLAVTVSITGIVHTTSGVLLGNIDDMIRRGWGFMSLPVGVTAETVDAYVAERTV